MAGPPPSLAAARNAVRTALADLAPGARVLVACSGGADSLALAVAARDVAPDAGWQVGAVVVDHRVQAGSGPVAERAATACRGLGLDPVLVRTVDVGRDGGPEGAARSARYTALTEAAHEHDAEAVLLGHTLDDQAETVLLGLARGAGTRSLAGMRARHGLWRRPLLGLRRGDTEAVCAAAGLEPWHDPTNRGRDDDPVRSRLRSRVMPVLAEVLGPGVPEALARTAQMLREDDEHLAEEARDALVAARSTGASASLVLDVGVLGALGAPVRRRAIHRALVEAGVPAGSLSRVHVLEVDRLLTDWRGQGPVAVPGRHQVSRRCGTLVVERLAARPQADAEPPTAPTPGTTKHEESDT